MLNHEAVEQVFHALGDPTRRMIVERLSRGPSSVSELAKPLEITLAAVVQHLQVLERSRIVRTEKIGRVRSCQLAGEGLRVAERWLSERRGAWERRFDRLAELLDEPGAAAPRTGRKKKP
jgi:DNA-binding transcriptional ArsR family regulator